MTIENEIWELYPSLQQTDDSYCHRVWLHKQVFFPIFLSSSSSFFLDRFKKKRRKAENKSDERLICSSFLIVRNFSQFQCLKTRRQNQFKIIQTRRSTDLEALKVSKVWSGAAAAAGIWGEEMSEIFLSSSLFFLGSWIDSRFSPRQEVGRSSSVGKRTEDPVINVRSIFLHSNSHVRKESSWGWIQFPFPFFCFALFLLGLVWFLFSEMVSWLTQSKAHRKMWSEV